MRTSESIAKIAPALLAAQRKMKAAPKDATNPHFKSKYADLATVIEAIKGALNEAGITVLQSPTNGDTGVTVETMLLHESGEWIADSIYLPVPQQTPQAYGSGITYARRYSLQSLVTLPSEDDDGNAASEQKPAARPNTATQVAADVFDGMGDDEKDFLRSHAMEILKMHAALRPDIHDYIVAQKFDNEEKLALWSLLPSDVRSTIRKQQAAAQTTATGKH